MGSLNLCTFIGPYQSGASLAVIAKQFGVPKCRVRTALLRAGVLRTRSEAMRLVDQSNRLKRVGFTHSDESKQKMREARRRWAADHARGTSIKPNGYVEYTTGEHKGRSVHVVAMERRLGRRLGPDEQVHHIDGDRQNNADDNLQLLTRAEHARLHRARDIHQRGRTRDGRFA